MADKNGVAAGSGLALGLALGVVIGVLTGNLAVWIAIGVAIGAALGAGGSMIGPGSARPSDPDGRSVPPPDGGA